MTDAVDFLSPSDVPEGDPTMIGRILVAEADRLRAQEEVGEMTEWRQDRPPLTDAHLAEIRERTKKGHILDWPNVDRAVLLSEVDRLRAQVAAVESLTGGPFSDGYRPYAVEVDGRVILAVGLDAVREALS